MGLLVANEAIHLLVIELPPSVGEEQGALAFSREEQLSWVNAAAQLNASLVAVLTGRSIELYSTESDRTRAFRLVLETLAARSKRFPALRTARAVALSGTEAARHLLRRSSGLDAEVPGDPRLLTQLHAATALSAFSRALGSALGPLFRSAVTVSRRVRQETALGDPTATAEAREFEELGAVRILEEELAAWQSQEAEITRVIAFASSEAPTATTSTSTASASSLPPAPSVPNSARASSVPPASSAPRPASEPAPEHTGTIRIARYPVFGDEEGSMIRLRGGQAARVASGE